MYRSKEIKLKIVEVVLEELPKQLAFSTELTAEEVVLKWFMTGNQEGLRLTHAGNHAFVTAKIEFFDVAFTAISIQPGWYGTLMEMSKKITCPYYLGVQKERKGKHNPYVRLYDSKVAMMVGLYGNMKEYLESIRLKTRKY
jgi:hypothetical protein